MYLIGRIVPALIAFGGVALYTRMLDPASFGTYALLLSTSLLFATTGFAWLRVATIRMMATAPAEDVPDFIATISAAFAGTSAVIAAAMFMTLYICNTTLPIQLALLTVAAAIASAGFELNVALTQARVQLISFGMLQGTRAIVLLGASIALLLAGLKAEALLSGFVLGNCVALGMLPTWLPGTRGKIRGDLFGRLFRFGWPSSATSLGYSVVTAQRYFLGIVSGSAAVGLFAVATDFSTQTIGLLMGTATIAGQPLAFRARDLGARDQLESQLQNNARLLFGVGFPATVGIVALAGPIAHTFFGARFTAGAEPIIVISALAILLSTLRGSYFEQAFEIAMNTRPIAILTIVRLVTTLALSYLLIYRFGIIGAASAVLIAEGIALGVSAIWASRIIEMPLPFASFVRVIVATCAMVCAIEVIPNRASPVGFSLAVITGTITLAVAFLAVYFRECLAIVRLPRDVTRAALRS